LLEEVLGYQRDEKDRATTIAFMLVLTQQNGDRPTEIPFSADELGLP
jgi:hypothetical protein